MTLTIDDREVGEHPELLTLIQIPYVVQRLDSADYAFLDYHGDPTGIERAEIGNLVQKVRSGELESQLYRCQDSYAHVILLTEGVYDKIEELLSTYKGGSRGYFRSHVYPHTRFDFVKAIQVRLSELGIELIDSPNFDCSVSCIRTIYLQRTKPEEQHTLFKRVRAVTMPTKLTNNLAVGRLMGLCPRLPEKVAIRLVNKYTTIWNIIHTDDKELLGTEGMGKGLVKKLKEGVGKE